MTLDLKYALKQAVLILPIERAQGRVVQVIHDWMGTTYKVRYFDGGEEKFTYLFEDELETVG